MSDISKLVVTGVACLALGAVAVIGFTNINPITTTSNVNAKEADIEAIVARYIEQNPEKLVESLQNFQTKMVEKQQQDAGQAVQENIDVLTSYENSPSIGTGESGVTIVEFFDYNCGYCKRMEPTVKEVLAAHPDIRFVFKEFPILSEGSQLASKAALAINYINPDKYMEYHSMLMQHKGQYDIAALKDYAGQVQVNLIEFEKEMNGERVAKELQQNQEIAAKVGVQGTPALIIGNELVPGAIPFADLDSRIKSLKEQQ